MELDTDKKGSLRALKEALMTKAGIAQDPLMAERAFGARHHGPQERAADFATALRKLFIQGRRKHFRIGQAIKKFSHSARKFS